MVNTTKIVDHEVEDNSSNKLTISTQSTDDIILLPEKVSIEGLLYSLAGNLAYSLTSPIVKIIYEHNPSISAYEILYWKSISMMVFNYSFVRSFGVFVMDVPKEYQKIIVFRALIGFFGIQGMWGSVKYMPVSTAGCIFFTMPLWTALIAFFLLKESLSKYDVFSIITAFLGVLVINNPWQEEI
jgi:drug/metabolite transporter (DMT)-like permease